jgi:phosphatidylglycerol:prolipoprotein diacylglycerol transferase
MLALSVLIGCRLALRLAGRLGMNPTLMDRCCLWTLAGAFVGARLLFVATHLDQMERLVDVVGFWNGGMGVYGGFLGGFVATIGFCRIHRLSSLAWADCAAPALCLGLLFTRIGCFLGGCDFGKPWDGPWAVHFPAGSPAFEQQMLQGLLPAGATRSLPVHPTQLYESIAGLALLVLTLAIHPRRRFTGQTFLSFVLGYGVLRYLIEMVRGDAGRGALGPLSTSQFIAVATFTAAAAVLLLMRRRHRDLLLDAEYVNVRTA